MIKESSNGNTRRGIAGILLVVVTLLMACNSKPSQPSDYPQIKIDAGKKTNLDANEHVSHIRYLALEASGKSLFSEIDKLLIKNGYIYILDITGLPYLYVFDMTGKFVNRIGNRGFGPGEYAKLTDFDIDDRGNILLYDRQRMQMLRFKLDGSLIDYKKTPFRADGFNLLNNGNFIFSLDKESADENFNGNSILVTDARFKTKSSMIPYDEDSSDDKATAALFSSNQDGILYNKPVNDTLFLFDFNGKLKKTYFFDFGSKTVPRALKNSYFDLSDKRSKNDYEYIYKKPFLIGKYIIGNMYKGNHRAMFLYNTQKDILDFKPLLGTDLSHLNINLPMETIADSVVVSYLSYDILAADHDKSKLSQQLIDHIEQRNNGTVLTFYTLK